MTKGMKVASRGRRMPCKHPGCEGKNYIAGYCFTHHGRFDRGGGLPVVTDEQYDVVGKILKTPMTIENVSKQTGFSMYECLSAARQNGAREVFKHEGVPVYMHARVEALKAHTAVYESIEKFPSISALEVMNLTGMSPMSARMHVAALHSNGFIFVSRWMLRGAVWTATYTVGSRSDVERPAPMTVAESNKKYMKRCKVDRELNERRLRTARRSYYKKHGGKGKSVEHDPLTVAFFGMKSK